jgi:hypothetical protein
MIVVVELFRAGIEHQAFNAGLLQAVVSAYPNERVEFWAESAHIKHVAHMIPSLSVEYIAVSVAPRHASFFKRAWADFQIVRKALNYSKNNNNRIIFSSISLPMLWFFKLSGGVPSHQIGAVVHGGLEDLRHRPRYNLIKRVISLRWVLTRVPDFVTFWVLEQSIYHSLQDLMPQYIHRFAVFLHPLPPDLIEEAHRPYLNPLSIGMLGLATPQKGLLVFLGLAKEFNGGNIDFELVGRIHQDYRFGTRFELQYLKSPVAIDPIPRAEFVARLKQLSYAAFFFDGDYYSLAASGVLLDCIALGIPLVARRHVQFEILQEEVGTIGLFCESGQEKGLIEDLSDVDPRDFSAQCEGIRRLREERMPSVLSEKIKKLLYKRSNK